MTSSYNNNGISIPVTNDTPLSDLVGSRISKILAAADLHVAGDILDTTAERLMQNKGIGEKRAEFIVNAVDEATNKAIADCRVSKNAEADDSEYFEEDDYCFAGTSALETMRNAMGRKDSQRIQCLNVSVKTNKRGNIISADIEATDEAFYENAPLRSGIYNSGTESPVVVYSHRKHEFEHEVTGEKITEMGKALGKLTYPANKVADNIVQITCDNEKVGKLLIDNGSIFFVDPTMFDKNGAQLCEFDRKGKAHTYSGINVAVYDRSAGQFMTFIPVNGCTRHMSWEELGKCEIICMAKYLTNSTSGIGRKTYYALKTNAAESNKAFDKRAFDILNAITVGGISIEATDESGKVVKINDYKVAAKKSGRFGMANTSNKKFYTMKSFAVLNGKWAAPTVDNCSGDMVEGFDGGAIMSVNAMRAAYELMTGMSADGIPDVELREIFFQGRACGDMTKFAMSVMPRGFIHAVIYRAYKKGNVIFVSDIKNFANVLRSADSKGKYVIYGITEEEFIKKAKEPEFAFDMNNMKALCDFSKPEGLDVHIMQLGHKPTRNCKTNVQVLQGYCAVLPAFRKVMAKIAIKTVKKEFEKFEALTSSVSDPKTPALIDANGYTNDVIGAIMPEAYSVFDVLRVSRFEALKNKISTILSNYNFQVRGTYLHSVGDYALLFGVTVLKKNECYSPTLQGQKGVVTRCPHVSPFEHVIAFFVTLKTIRKRLDALLKEGKISKHERYLIYTSYSELGDAYFVVPNSDEFKQLTGGSDNDWDGYSIIVDKEYVDVVSNIPQIPIDYDNDAAKAAAVLAEDEKVVGLKMSSAVFKNQAYAPNESIGQIDNRVRILLSLIMTRDKNVLRKAMYGSFKLNDNTATCDVAYERQVTDPTKVTMSLINKVISDFKNSRHDIKGFKKFLLDIVTMMPAIEGFGIDANKNGSEIEKVLSYINDLEAKERKACLYSRVLSDIAFVDVKGDVLDEKDSKAKIEFVYKFKEAEYPGAKADQFLIVEDFMSRLIAKIARACARKLTDIKNDVIEIESAVADKIYEGIKFVSLNVDHAAVKRVAPIMRLVRKSELSKERKADLLSAARNTILKALRLNDCKVTHENMVEVALKRLYAILAASTVADEEGRRYISSLFTAFHEECVIGFAALSGRKVYDGHRFIVAPNKELKNNTTVEIVNGKCEYGTTDSSVNGTFTFRTKVNAYGDSKSVIVRPLASAIKLRDVEDEVIVPIATNKMKDSKAIATITSLLEDAQANPDVYTGYFDGLETVRILKKLDNNKIVIVGQFRAVNSIYAKNEADETIKDAVTGKSIKGFMSAYGKRYVKFTEVADFRSFNIDTMSRTVALRMQFLDNEVTDEIAKKIVSLPKQLAEEPIVDAEMVSTTAPEAVSAATTTQIDFSTMFDDGDTVEIDLGGMN